jgi:hypothetical protein
MPSIFRAFIDAIRFTRTYQRKSRIADDAASVPAHDAAATMHESWNCIERERALATKRQREADEAALKAGSPSAHFALRAARDSDFPA